MSVTIVLSTANARVSKLVLPVKAAVSYVLVHQVYGAADQHASVPGNLLRDDVNYIRLEYPGLSKSRNAGISSVASGYAYIMDDDVKFDVEKIAYLTEWMESNNVDVATCQFAFLDGSFPKRYSDKPFKHTLRSVAKVSSIEICIDVERIRSKGILFDERFGLGADLPSGEEYVFLTDCIKAGLSVWFFPLVTGVHPNITSGSDFYTTPEKVIAKREMLKRVFGWKSPLFIFAFWLKKAPSIFRSGYFWQFTTLMLSRNRRSL